MGYENFNQNAKSEANQNSLDFADIFDAMGKLPDDVRRNGPDVAKAALQYAKEHPVEAGALVVGGAVTAIGIAEFSGVLMATGLMCELGTVGYLGVQAIKQNFGPESNSHGVPTVIFDRKAAQSK